MNESNTDECACPDCHCEIRDGHDVLKNDLHYCSEACADGHASGEGCCNDTCHCHG